MVDTKSVVVFDNIKFSGLEPFLCMFSDIVRYGEVPLYYNKDKRTCLQERVYGEELVHVHSEDPSVVILTRYFKSRNMYYEVKHVSQIAAWYHKLFEWDTHVYLFGKQAPPIEVLKPIEAKMVMLFIATHIPNRTPVLIEPARDDVLRLQFIQFYYKSLIPNLQKLGVIKVTDELETRLTGM